MSSLLGAYGNLSVVKGSVKNRMSHSKRRKKYFASDNLKTIRMYLAKSSVSKHNTSKIRGNFLPQEATGTTSRKKLKDVSELTYKASTTKANTVKSKSKGTTTKASTSTQKQDKLFGGSGWGLTEKAQKKLPKILQKIGVGQTEKTVTIMGKKLTFKAPDPRKKKVNPVTGFVSYG